MRTPFKIGVESVLPGQDDWFATIYGCWLGKYFTEEQLGMALREVGAQFTLFYDSLAPRKPNACARIDAMCQRLNIPYLYNNTYGDIYGPWLPGTGRASYSDEQLEHAAATGLFRGVIWDEVEHRQLHGVDTGRAPYFFDAHGLSPEQCYDKMVEVVSGITAGYAAHGAESIAEMVFPVLVHELARAGMHPAPKVLKESFNPLVLAIAMGAALQYKRELWAVADLWGLIPFWGSLFTGAYEGAPAHSPDEYLSALLLCYWMGLDAVYTEGLYNLITPVHTTPEEWQELADNPIFHRGGDNPLVLGYRKKGYVVTAYGKMQRWFSKEYVPAHPRTYTFRDVKPEVAVICLPDSTWASRTGSSWSSKDTLFGPGGPAKLARHEAILDVIHILTHGVVPREGITMHNEPFSTRGRAAAQQIEAADDPTVYPFDDFHSGFCPVNGVVFYDHTVEGELLREIPLLICTGEVLSEGTQAAIQQRVRQGARCLAHPHLLPGIAKQDVSGVNQHYKDGKGEYLFTEEMNSEPARVFIQPHLGSRDAVTYRFGDQLVTIKPQGGKERRLGMQYS
ncbi:MAG: hypothetical protein ACYC6L_09985 [Anaerolineae bacterium]